MDVGDSSAPSVVGAAVAVGGMVAVGATVAVGGVVAVGAAVAVGGVVAVGATVAVEAVGAAVAVGAVLAVGAAVAVGAVVAVSVDDDSDPCVGGSAVVCPDHVLPSGSSEPLQAGSSNKRTNARAKTPWNNRGALISIHSLRLPGRGGTARLNHSTRRKIACIASDTGQVTGYGSSEALWPGLGRSVSKP